MRILVDRHHADLLYALQRLFQSRLGMFLYVPVGREWWDEGYWQFGKSLGDDRLVRQYLEVHDGIYHETAEPGIYYTRDPAHPRTDIYCTTLEAARRGEWDFVMPSVQENQQGFHRFAQEHGAQYLYNVGNTGQHIDWNLDPLVLSNSEVPLLGRGIVIHQEIDSGPGETYCHTAPLRTRTVSNFVNAFDRLPGYGEFLDAEANLGAPWTFRSHGHEGRDGDIQPAAKVGALMAESGWGWHDKPVGDGFGHVVHSWAAVGRPLIGHARYYQGRLAEPFWVHGETCIDLDLLAFHDALALMEEIARDPVRHSLMCRAIHEVFDRHVDYPAEAAAVARILGLED